MAEEREAEIVELVQTISRERALEKGELEAALESALKVGYMKDRHLESPPENLRVELDLQKGIARMYLLKRVVPKVENPVLEISVEEATKKEPYTGAGEFYREEISLKDFSRIALQAAGEEFVQNIINRERENLFQKMKVKENELVTGKIYKIDERGDVWLDLNKLDAVLEFRERIRDEKLRRGKELEVLLLKITKTPTGVPLARVSRTHPDLLKKLFEREIPEVIHGLVEVKKVVRSPGVRAKVAVVSKDPNVDPVGACIGAEGRRILPIVRMLSGERIDVIHYDDDPKKFVSNALSPLKLQDINAVHIVNLEPGKRKMIVEVPDKAYSQAIGKQGENVRLAGKLTGWYIDIVKESEFKALPALELEKTDLPAGVVEILKKNGLNVVGDLFRFTISELSALEGVGEENALLIEKFLVDKGILVVEAPEEEEMAPEEAPPPA